MFLKEYKTEEVPGEVKFDSFEIADELLSDFQTTNEAGETVLKPGFALSSADEHYATLSDEDKAAFLLSHPTLAEEVLAASHSVSGEAVGEVLPQTDAPATDVAPEAPAALAAEPQGEVSAPAPEVQA